MKKQSTFRRLVELEVELFLFWLLEEAQAWFNKDWVVVPEFLSSMYDKMLEGKWSCQIKQTNLLSTLGEYIS